MYQKGWNSIRELIKKLPGEYEYPIPANEKEMMNTKSKKNFILVVFIGGITYNEISAIRYLNKINKGKIIIYISIFKRYYFIMNISIILI
jgi:hypothetical protein